MSMSPSPQGAHPTWTPHFYRQMPGPRRNGQMPALRGVGVASCFYVVWASLLCWKPKPRRAGICPFYHIGTASAAVYKCHPKQEDRGAFVKPRAPHLPIEVRVGWGWGAAERGGGGMCCLLNTVRQFRPAMRLFQDDC